MSVEIISGIPQSAVGPPPLPWGLRPTARRTARRAPLSLGVAGGAGRWFQPPATLLSKQAAPRAAWGGCGRWRVSSGAVIALRPGFQLFLLLQYGPGETHLQSSAVSAHVFLPYTARRSQRTAPYRGLIHIDLCFMLPHRMEHSTAGHPAAWRGAPPCYLASLCLAGVCLREEKKRSVCEAWIHKHGLMAKWNGGRCSWALIAHMHTHTV